MIKCPECGAEYIVQPDICAQCGAQFDSENQIQDLFAAARRQEQQSLAQQQAQREAFRKLHEETHSRELPEPETKSGPQPDAVAAVPQETGSSEAEPVQKSRKWTLAGVAVMTVLILIAVFTLRDGFKEKRHPTDKYAFYLQDNALWFYRDDTGKKYLLTENETPQKELPDAQFQSLTQLSADGRRVYYPLNITQTDTCQIAYRDLDHPDQEHILTWIRMFPDVKKTVQETGRLGETEAFALTDMLPSYIADGDTLFYFNLNGELCRMPLGGEEEVLSRIPVRYWKVSGMDGIYFLSMRDEKNAMLRYHNAQEKCQSEQQPWGIMETAGFPCKLQYCPTDGSVQSFHPVQELEIWEWAVPYASSDNYFYFVEETKEGSLILRQADLVQQGFCDMIGYGTPDQTLDMTLLCAYPDGSCYYATIDRPQHSSTLNVFLHFFNRKEAQNYNLYGLYGYTPSGYEGRYFDNVDIFPGEPLLTMGFQSIERPYIFRGRQFVSTELQADYYNRFGIKVQIDTQYPVAFLSDDEAMKRLISSAVYEMTEDQAAEWLIESDSGEFSITSGDPDDPETEWTPVRQPSQMLYAQVSDNGKAVYRAAQNTAKDSSYFAYQPQGASAPEIFCWNQKNSELLLPNGQKAQADRIIRKDGSLFCHSGTDSSISIYRDNALQRLTGETAIIQADNWQALSGDTVLAVSDSKELKLYTSEQMRTIGAADRIIAAGTLPQAEEESE